MYDASCATVKTDKPSALKKLKKSLRGCEDKNATFSQRLTPKAVDERGRVASRTLSIQYLYRDDQSMEPAPLPDCKWHKKCKENGS